MLHSNTVFTFDWCVSLYLVRQLGVPVVEFVLWGSNRIGNSALTLFLFTFGLGDPLTFGLVEQFVCSLLQLVVWSGQSIEPAPILLCLLCC